MDWSVPFVFIGFGVPLLISFLSIALVAILYVAAASTVLGCILIFLEMVISVDILEWSITELSIELPRIAKYGDHEWSVLRSLAGFHGNSLRCCRSHNCRLCPSTPGNDHVLHNYCIHPLQSSPSFKIMTQWRRTQKRKPSIFDQLLSS